MALREEIGQASSELVETEPEPPLHGPERRAGALRNLLMGEPAKVRKFNCLPLLGR
jgi:hypothetical protein